MSENVAACSASTKDTITVSSFPGESLKVYSTKSGRTWYSLPIEEQHYANVRAPQRNRGLTVYSEGVETPLDALRLFVDQHVLQTIITETNRRAASTVHQAWERTDEVELLAFLGLWIAIAATHTGKRSDAVNWGLHTPFRLPIYSMAMSRNRFQAMKRFLRFDDRATRAERRRSDKLAAIRDIFETIVDNCRKAFYPGKFVTVDEQLAGFRGRCAFRQYISNKPDKYGIKVWALCDADCFYAWNLQVYTGKAANEASERNQARRVVLDMVEPLAAGHNVTTDNFFTSVELAELLHERGHTLLGTMRKNKPNVPECFNTADDRPLHSTLFGFSEYITLASYVAKRKRAVLMLSTFTHDRRCAGADHNWKPELIRQYNKTKGGVDQCDQMIKSASCTTTTNRWSLRLFMHMFNIAHLNAFIVYCVKHNVQDVRRRRIEFLLALAEEMIRPHSVRRLTTAQLPRSVREDIRTYFRIEAPGAVARDLSNEEDCIADRRKRCEFHTRRDDVKTAFFCGACKKFTCKEHSVKTVRVRCFACLTPGGCHGVREAH